MHTIVMTDGTEGQAQMWIRRIAEAVWEKNKHKRPIPKFATRKMEIWDFYYPKSIHNDVMDCIGQQKEEFHMAKRWMFWLMKLPFNILKAAGAPFRPGELRKGRGNGNLAEVEKGLMHAMVICHKTDAHPGPHGKGAEELL